MGKKIFVPCLDVIKNIYKKYKRKVFDKGYTPNWTEEIFVVDEVLQQSLLLIELLI